MCALSLGLSLPCEACRIRMSSRGRPPPGSDAEGPVSSLDAGEGGGEGGGAGDSRVAAGCGGAFVRGCGGGDGGSDPAARPEAVEGGGEGGSVGEASRGTSGGGDAKHADVCGAGGGGSAGGGGGNGGGGEASGSDGGIGALSLEEEAPPEPESGAEPSAPLGKGGQSYGQS